MLTALGLALGSYAEHRNRHGLVRCATNISLLQSAITEMHMCMLTWCHVLPCSSVAALLGGLELAFVNAASADVTSSSPGMQEPDGTVADDFDMDLDVGDGSSITCRSYYPTLWRSSLLSKPVNHLPHRGVLCGAHQLIGALLTQACPKQRQHAAA